MEPVGDEKVSNHTQEMQSKNINRKLLRSMIEQQAYCCALSGWDLSPEDAVLDHIVPVSKGGALKEVGNIQIVHSTINRMKGMMSQSEFIAACKAVAAWVD